MKISFPSQETAKKAGIGLAFMTVGVLCARYSVKALSPNYSRLTTCFKRVIRAENLLSNSFNAAWYGTKVGAWSFFGVGSGLSLIGIGCSVIGDSTS